MPASLQPNQGIATALFAVPLHIRLIALLLSPFCEELLFRAYLIERVEALTGSTLLAASISVILNSLAHVSWNNKPIAFAPSNAVTAAFYVWRRNLPCSTLLHIWSDSPMVLLPLLGFVPGRGIKR